MSPNIKYVLEDETTEAAEDSMSGLQVRRLPVLNREKRLVEIVSIGDLALKYNGPVATALKKILNRAAQLPRAYLPDDRWR
jgi:CBS domain-containing protein